LIEISYVYHIYVLIYKKYLICHFLYWKECIYNQLEYFFNQINVIQFQKYTCYYVSIFSIFFKSISSKVILISLLFVIQDISWTFFFLTFLFFFFISLDSVSLRSIYDMRVNKWHITSVHKSFIDWDFLCLPYLCEHTHTYSTRFLN
jgi:hypothetical protein